MWRASAKVAYGCSGPCWGRAFAGETAPNATPKASTAARAIPAAELVDAPAFPDWARFAAFSAHVAFVNMHHHQIERLANVTGAPLLRTVATAASALLSPE